MTISNQDYRLCLRALCKKLGNMQEAEDLLQQTILQLIAKPKTLTMLNAPGTSQVKLIMFTANFVRNRVNQTNTRRKIKHARGGHLVMLRPFVGSQDHMESMANLDGVDLDNVRKQIRRERPANTTKTDWRRNYNKDYYAKNKEKILAARAARKAKNGKGK